MNTENNGESKTVERMTEVSSERIKELMDKWGKWGPFMGFSEDTITRKKFKEGKITEEEAFLRLI
tara:strand:- start:2659 stop:2853 length:195 start_codon:yes stop_codon:yes gene_type:complete